MFPILSVVTFLPLLGAIIVLFLPRESFGAIRWTALVLSLLELLLSLGLLLVYSQSTVSATFLGTFHYNENLAWIPGLGINYSLGVDGISVLLVVLTTLLTTVCIAASFRIEQKVKNYMAFMLLFECGMIGVFLATNLFLFYIFWELMLIPAYFLVGTWGGQRRIYAAFKFVLYTSVGSLLMLAGIIALGYYHQVAAGGSYTLDLAALLNTKLNSGIQLWLLLAFAAAFAVKVPFVPFHSWLPDAYSEAPAPVTALLAGAMAKTGAYGFLRFCLPLFPDAIQTLAPLFRILAVIGILYCAVLALTQTDIKRLLAYSSISHLGVIMLGMFAFNPQGIEGSVLQMVNHGITIAALFLIAGYFEARTGTRKLTDFGGLATRVPVLATVALIAALSSLGLPGLNSFAGEFLALLGTFRSSAVFGILGTIVVVPAAWYMLRFFQGITEGPRQQQGVVATLIRKGTLSDIHLGEFVTLLPLLVLIFFIGLLPSTLTFILEPSVVNTLQILGNAFVK
ncbi:NADH-quinone oxidoreductase subunit M [Ktedonosporobacter rubrisoli]|uniref:NADH-quinone oxidoreductase subunit M n=1 Tax=Ktedonosporobacter rubrisoli TaxID=2509675 RepID=A0A4P6JYQ1_KTERU|nr:NADH-quinone oxidoreductase subunit M [Ktedonosporobacter rubrisoli]QBD80176.1 NADH-quinone oxidoreductase subunit M [Ktedonosporobacter rubrisoli]